MDLAIQHSGFSGEDLASQHSGGGNARLAAKPAAKPASAATPAPAPAIRKMEDAALAPADDIDVSKLNYMKLKRHMKDNGFTDAEVNAEVERGTLLHMWNARKQVSEGSTRALRGPAQPTCDYIYPAPPTTVEEEKIWLAHKIC